jgi:hypothetical protein
MVIFAASLSQVTPPWRPGLHITVLGESSSLPLMLEPRTVVYHTGTLFAGYDRRPGTDRKTMISDSVLDPGRVPETKGVTRSAIGARKRLLDVFVLTSI